MEYRECACGCGLKFEVTKKHKKYYDLHHKWRAEKRNKGGESLKTKEKQWNKMSAIHRWEKMTLSEIEAESLRLHLSYGQLQAMAQNNTLPKDFGKGVRK